MSPTPCSVRRAEARDAAELVRLRHGMFLAMAERATDDRPREVDDTSWYAAAITEVEQQMSHGVLAAFVVDERDGGATLVAAAIATLHRHLPGPAFPRGLRGSVSSVFVEEACRRQGLARLVVSAGLEWLDEQGAELVDLHATPQALGLYRSLGFVERSAPSLRRLRMSGQRA